MSARFVNVDRNTPLLLPPDLRDWLPEDHLVHFVLEVVETMDMGEFKVNERGTGNRQYPPSMMLSLLAYCYATGYYSQSEVETLEESGVEAFVAVERQAHGRSLASILGEEEPAPPERQAQSARQKMKRKLFPEKRRFFRRLVASAANRH